MRTLSVTALAVTCLSPDLALPLTVPYKPASATRERDRVYIGVLTSLTLSSSLLSLVSLLYRQNLQD
jgi:predicted cobalt transporter CbtA